MAADAPSILLVDDRPENLVALQAVLAPLGARLVCATSGAEALKKLLEEEFALILLDVQMPELDGFETAEYIKRRPRTRHVPIIFLTAISKEEEHVFRGYETGAVDYVFKPYDPVVLRSKVAVFVELWRAGRALRASEAMTRAAFDFAPIGMALLDSDGNVMAANRALAQTLERELDELVGHSFERLTHRQDRHTDRDQRRRLLAGELDRYEHERRLLPSAGRAVPTQVSLSLAPSPDGDRPMVLAQVQDLRERRRAERARELLVREQAARVEAEAVSERLRAIQQVLDAALAPLALDELLGELLSRIVSVLEVDTASFVLEEPDGSHVIVQGAEGDGVPVHRQAFTPSPDGPYAQVTREAAPLVIEDASEDELLRAPLPGAAVSSLMAVPLLAQGRVLGALTVGSLFRRPFSAADADLLQLAAERAALAIERARSFEREHRIAQQLQRSLLPERLPTVRGLRLAARYLPGGAGTEVGGDWYDALELPGGRLALVLGDVAGRGVPAAATMGQLRSALRAYALEGSGPAEVLERLNRFQHQLGPDSMATVVVLVLHPAEKVLRYANAGHPPPLLVIDGEAAFLEHRGVPLGAVDEPGYREVEAALAPGATVVVYTDGLVEQRDSPLQEGLERLRLASAASAVDPEALCDAILGGTLGEAVSSDDVTFVVASSADVLGDRLTLSLPGEQEGLSTLRGTLRRWLAEHEADAEEVSAVTMATNEAVQNAIEHGHLFQPLTFEVDLEREQGDVVVTVRDQGSWREPVNGNGDRGRGIPLMRSLMDRVDVHPGPEGSTVVLRRRLRAGAAG